MDMAMRGFSLGNKANNWAYKAVSTTAAWAQATANKARNTVLKVRDMVRKPLM
jgi:hypothetical protein